MPIAPDYSDAVANVLGSNRQPALAEVLRRHAHELAAVLVEPCKAGVGPAAARILRIARAHRTRRRRVDLR